jgi:hypothetical protein
MIKARKREPWPFGNDSPADRARTVAAFCWQALDEVDPGRAEEIRKLAARFGEDIYLAPTWSTVAPGQLLTRAEVAELAHVTPTAVAMWGSRGIVRRHQRHYLVPRPGGRYHPDDVDAFLRLYNTPDHQPSTPG